MFKVFPVGTLGETDALYLVFLIMVLGRGNLPVMIQRDVIKPLDSSSL
jgi:hypothetical protein